MSKAIILPFFLLAGLASGSQQPQGIVSNNYYDEDVEGGSLQRVTALSGHYDGAQQEDEVVFGDDGAANLELEKDEYAVDSTTTDFYDYENNNADDEEVVDERRRQLRGNSNRRLNRNRPECRVGWAGNNCPSGETCWRRRIGSSMTGNGVCIPNDACLPTNVFVAWPTRGSLDAMARDCCSGKAWYQIGDIKDFFVCY